MTTHADEDFHALRETLRQVAAQNENAGLSGFAGIIRHIADTGNADECFRMLMATWRN